MTLVHIWNEMSNFEQNESCDQKMLLLKYFKVYITYFISTLSNEDEENHQPSSLELTQQAQDRFDADKSRQSSPTTSNGTMKK